MVRVHSGDMVLMPTTKITNMKTVKCYGVLLGLKQKYPNHPFIATNGKGAPAVFDTAKGARQYRDELAEHACKGRVVRVDVCYEGKV